MDTPAVQKDYQEHEKWLNMQDACAVMESVSSYKNIVFSDDKTKLLDCIRSMEKPSTLQRFLQNTEDIDTSLPSDSPLWPGSTPLHLAVMFSESMKNDCKAASLLTQFLDRGASIQVQNHRGATPLHLAFHLQLTHIKAVLLRHLEKKPEELVNLMDDENLSYLHIFCAASHHRASLARTLLSSQRDTESSVNVAYKGRSLANVEVGWTPLHVAVHRFQFSLVKLLLQRGASTACTDARGYTAVHRLFGTAGKKPLADLLFASRQLRDCAVEGVGLTHLHVAVWFDDVEAVKRLLDLGANIEATVEASDDGDLMKFVGCTPLHLAVLTNRRAIVRTLLNRGANVLAKSHDGTSLLSKTLTGCHKYVANAFLNLIWRDGQLQRRMEEELGVTMLHVACHTCDLGKVKNQLEKGADTNARVHEDSNFWMGYTPLHVLIVASHCWENDSFRPDRSSAGVIFKALVQHGCDVNLKDCAGKTAFHLALTMKDCDYNYKATPEFLSAGADINTVDKNGKSAILYALEFYLIENQWTRWELPRINAIVFQLTLHTCKMKLVGLDVNERDEILALAALQKHSGTSEMNRGTFEIPHQCVFYGQVQATVKIKIGQRGLTLRSFLYETSAISLYPSLTPTDRDAVDAFFRKVDDQSFPEVSSLLKLQHSKAVARLSLIDPARDSLKAFICSNFPDLCVDMILRYLSNLQLKQLIIASADEYDV